MVRKKGRFIVEASYLVPLICILLVFLVYFTLRAHDYAVCAHTAIECGVKELCQTGRTNREIQEQLQAGLEQKLPKRLLWMQEPRIETDVGPLSIKIHIEGPGKLLSEKGIQFQQTLSRREPCKTIRRIKWLKEHAKSDKG